MMCNICAIDHGLKFTTPFPPASNQNGKGLRMRLASVCTCSAHAVFITWCVPLASVAYMCAVCLDKHYVFRNRLGC